MTEGADGTGDGTSVPVGDGVPVGDADRVGVVFATGLCAVADGDGVHVGPGEVEDCAGAGALKIPAVAGGLTSR